MPRIPSRPPLDLSGKWAVIELPTMDEDYLALTPDPHVLITHTEFERFSATFQFGAQQGEIDGRVDEVWTHHAAHQAVAPTTSSRQAGDTRQADCFRYPFRYPFHGPRHPYLAALQGEDGPSAC